MMNVKFKIKEGGDREFLTAQLRLFVLSAFYILHFELYIFSAPA